MRIETEGCRRAKYKKITEDFYESDEETAISHLVKPKRDEIEAVTGASLYSDVRCIETKDHYLVLSRGFKM